MHLQTGWIASLILKNILTCRIFYANFRIYFAPFVLDMMGEGGGGSYCFINFVQGCRSAGEPERNSRVLSGRSSFLSSSKINSSLQGLGFSCLQQGPTEYRLLKKSSLCFTAVATCALCRPILAPSKPMTSWQLQTGFLLHSAKSRIRGLVTSSEVSHQFPDFR